VITGEDEARAFVAQRCDSDAFARLGRLVEMLGAENSRQNLVSAASTASVWQRHIADSIQLLDHVPRGTTPWLDLGTGAGFPGIVISVARPDCRVVLVESRKRRIEWLSALSAELGLRNCHIEGKRLEVVDSFDTAVISARAFAPLDKLIRLGKRFSTSDTTWLLPKGRTAEQEVSALPSELQSMFHVEQSATDADSGIVVGRIPRERFQ
jgi:16S rRNA (guanine527-N7)-methyltransferase